MTTNLAKEVRTYTKDGVVIANGLSGFYGKDGKFTDLSEAYVFMDGHEIEFIKNKYFDSIRDDLKFIRVTFIMNVLMYD